MTAHSYRYFDPHGVLAKLHGDQTALMQLTQAYLRELPAQVNQLQPEFALQNVPALRATLHQIRATFGMFDARRGSALERWIIGRLDDGYAPTAEDLHGLICEMLGLSWELRLFLRQSAANDGKA